MPFPFDMSQVFWGLMNKTMWDCRFGNMNNGFSGFNGGFMNSCWGGGFQMPMWGDSCSFSSTGGSSSLTAEERVEKRKAEEKYTALKGAIQDYIKTLNPTTDKDLKMLLEERLKDCGSSYSVANYEKLTELYEEYKDKIQKKLKSDEGIEPSDKSKAAAKEFTNANIDFKKILATEGESAATKAELAKDVDAMEFLYSLQTNKTNKKTFKQVYTDALKGADTTKTTELKKVLEAVYNGLTKEALEVKKEDGISEETMASLGKLLEISAESATADNVEQLYYWIRMAKAEAADSKYACLQEEFPEFKQSNGVESTTAALKAEGLEPEKIKTQTVVTNYSEMENDSTRMQSLVDNSLQTALSAEQLKDLKNVPGVDAFLKSNKIKKVYMDPSPQIFGQMFIRVIDKDGNLKCLTGVAAEKDANGKITFKAIKQPLVGGAQEDGKIAFGSSITPEQIEEQAKMVSQINDAIKDGTLTEVSQKWSNGRRMFEEKEITGDRNYKRIFFIESDGKLKEWQGVWYNKDKGFRQIQGSKTPYVDANLSDIQNDIINASKKDTPKVNNVQVLTDEQKNKAIETGGYMRGNLVGYTTDGCWEAFDTNMKTVNDNNVLYILKGYIKGVESNVDRGFFTQVFTENTSRTRRAKYTKAMADHIVAYINNNISSVSDGNKTELETIKQAFQSYKFNDNAHHKYNNDAKEFDKYVKRLLEIFDIKEV
ncbi:MAG: hypothetical protein NC408_08235 [Candidatus Gastranaerophilales bacterium]|nr:hypothetical protein [Candidatus Gastranaerophilales bacterium]MCM1072634.1 hypothetical protein [Bacteroides sp.]